jgi:uncharacterized protein with PQ loop repeat
MWLVVGWLAATLVALIFLKFKLKKSREINLWNCIVALLMVIGNWISVVLFIVYCIIDLDNVLEHIVVYRIKDDKNNRY